MVRTFPNGSILIVLQTHDTRSVTPRDQYLAKKITRLAKTASVNDCGTMTLTLGAERPAGSAPGLLVDIDGTIVESDWAEHPGRIKYQKQREGVKRALELYQSMGVRIIGVTNRSGSADGEGHSPEEIQALNEEVLGWFPELTDIVFCGSFNDAARKPAPDMLDFAARHYNLDPVLAMIGDSQEDCDAACAAGVMHFAPEEFFDDPEVYRAVLSASAVTKVSVSVPSWPRSPMWHR